MRITKEQTGLMFVVLSGLCYGLLGYFGMSIMRADLSVYAMSFLRFLVTGLVVLPFMLRYYDHKAQSPKDLAKLVLYGVFFYGVGTIFYFNASQYVGTGLAMVVFFTFPIFVILINKFLFKAKINTIYYFSVALMLLGLVLLIDLQDMHFDMLGLGLGLISAFFYACYIVGSKRSAVSPITSTFMVSVGCMVPGLVLSVVDSSFVIPSDPGIWLNVFGLAIICTAIPIWLMMYGLQYVSSEKASILSVLEPIFVVFFGIILLDEKVASTQALGIIAVLLAAIITIFSQYMTTEKI